MPSSALVTQLFSSLMRVYRTFPPVAPKTNKRLTANRFAANRTGEIANYFQIVRATNPLGRDELWSKVYGYQVFSGKAVEPSFVNRIRFLAEFYASQVCSPYCRIDKVTKEGRLVLTEWARAQ